MIITVVLVVLLVRACIAAARSLGLARSDLSRVQRRLVLPAQELVTQDERRVRVEAVVYYRVVDEHEAPGNARDRRSAVVEMAEASLRSVLGGVEPHELRSGRTEAGGLRRAGAGGVPQDAPPYGPHDAAGRPQDAATALVVAEGGLTHHEAETVDRAVLNSIPRPVGGPACFGGRDDAGYLCGWDDVVDGIRRGREVSGPRWGSAAYMTGWNDGMRAVEAVRRGRPWAAEAAPPALRCDCGRALTPAA